MTVISILLVFLYAIFIHFCVKGWKRPTILKGKDGSNIKFSIVIAARNEAANIGLLLDDLKKQNYPMENFELLLVDDHSEDATLEIIGKYAGDQHFNLRFFSLNRQFGKKAAIEKGIEQASHEHIVITDADCRMGRDWLKLYARYFHQLQAQFLAAAVVLKADANTLLSSLQQFEFSILSGTTAAFFALGDPIMCNAANMAFKKSLYIAAKASTHKDLASGDDVFLLHRAKQLFPDRIFFILDEGAVVKSRVKTQLNSFIQQRLRWAGKSRYYTDTTSLAVGSLILLINALLLLLLIISFASSRYVLLLAGVFFIKFCLDLYLVKQFQGFFHLRRLLLKSFLLSLLYPFYSVGIAFFSIFVKVKWKGRKI